MKMKPVVSPIVLADIALVDMTSFLLVLLAVGEAAVGVAGLRAQSIFLREEDASGIVYEKYRLGSSVNLQASQRRAQHGARSVRPLCL